MAAEPNRGVLGLAHVQVPCLHYTLSEDVAVKINWFDQHDLTLNRNDRWPGVKL